jgi:excisionase family DNA binding protein
MRIPDAAKYVGISPGYMKRLVAQKKVLSTAIGRTRVVLRASLDQLLRDGLL